MHSNFWGWLKKFGPAQNILGPVKGQGTTVYKTGHQVNSLHRHRRPMSQDVSTLMKLENGRLLLTSLNFEPIPIMFR